MSDKRKAAFDAWVEQYHRDHSGFQPTSKEYFEWFDQHPVEGAGVEFPIEEATEAFTKRRNELSGSFAGPPEGMDLLCWTEAARWSWSRAIRARSVGDVSELYSWLDKKIADEKLVDPITVRNKLDLIMRSRPSEDDDVALLTAITEMAGRYRFQMCSCVARSMNSCEACIEIQNILDRLSARFRSKEGR